MAEQHLVSNSDLLLQLGKLEGQVGQILQLMQANHTATNQRLEQQLQAAGHPLPFDYAPGGHTWHYWQALMPQIMPTLARQLQPAPLP